MSGSQRRTMRRFLSSPSDRSKTPPSEDAPDLRPATSGLGRLKRSVTKLRRGHRRQLSESQGVSTAMAPALTAPTAAQLTVDTNKNQAVRLQLGVDYKAFLSALPEMEALDGNLTTAQSMCMQAQQLASTMHDTVSFGRVVRNTSEVSEHVSRSFVAGKIAAAAPLLPQALVSSWERVCEASRAAAAEQRIDDCMQLMHEMDTLVSQARSVNFAKAWVMEDELTGRKTSLASYLESKIAAPLLNSSPDERRQLVRYLADIAGPSHALSNLLISASRHLQSEVEALDLDILPSQQATPNTNAETDSNAHQRGDDTVNVAAAHGQVLSQCILTTFNDAEAVFSDSSPKQPGIGGQLVHWAIDEVVLACDFLRRQVLEPLAVPSGLTCTTKCVLAFLVYCDALQRVLSMPASSIAADKMFPAVDAALHRRVRQVEEGLRREALKDAKASLSASKFEHIQAPDKASWQELVVVFPSSKRLLAELRSIAEAVTCIACPRAIDSLKQATSTLFASYVEVLSNALSGGPAAACEVAMEVATRLVEKALADSSKVTSEAGWGPTVADGPLLEALDAMATTLGMDTVHLAGVD